jgi:asparagine synthase (glutamine-hydrolysing)
VTVALSGDGGDENFAGYRRYKHDLYQNQIRSYFPAPMRRAIFGPLGQLYPKMDWAPRVFRGKSTFQSLARSPLEGYFHGISFCPPELKAALFSPAVRRELNGYDSIDVLRAHYAKADTPDLLSRIQYVDIKTYLTDCILTKVDRASMANSLEVRCPLLDHKLMELIATMPSNLKLHNGQGKYIFKKALAPILPSSILNRPKQGFSMPVAEWMRSDLKGFAYETIFSQQDGFLERSFLTRCWTQHQRGHRDWSALLWCVLMFRVWQGVHKSV